MPSDLRQYHCIVLGSGIAGLYFSLHAASQGKVAILTKKHRAESNTNYAQGGIAADKSRRKGDRIIKNTKAVFTKYFDPNDGQFQSTLDNYFNPNSGQFHQRIRQLIEENGELETVIHKQIEDDDPPLGKALTARNQTILDNFLKHFDLNKEDSALNKMLNQLKKKYQKILEKMSEEKGLEEESHQSTWHGVKFEKYTVFNFIQEWNERKCDANHIVEHTGGKSGNLRAKKDLEP